jgi:pimeloyl-ACP methyl ester carboxylesterase
VAQKLSQKNYVLVPDLRGCGQSNLGTDEPSLNLLAKDILELVETEQLSEVILAGISLGGYVAMELSRINQEVLSGLILLDTKACADSSTAKENRLRIATQMESGAKVSLFAEQMLESVVGNYTLENRPDVVALVKNWMLDASPQTIAWLQRAMSSRPESFSTLEKLDVPVLLIRGAQDGISSAQDFVQMQKNLRQVTYIEISNAGHLPPVEDPVATFAAIDQWLTTFAN